MSLFKSIFGKKQQPRHLTKVADLKVGDALSFSDSFALPAQLRQQNFQVTAVNTYQYEHQDSVEFTLQGETHLQVYLSVEQDDDVWLNISIKLNRDQVGILFDLDCFADIFDDQAATELALLSEPSEYQNWLSPVYFQHTCGERAYYYRQDFRPNKAPMNEDSQGEPLDYFGLTSSDDKYSVDVEVWEGGETDIALTLHRPLTDVADLYPGTI